MAAAAGIYFISQIKSESEKLKEDALESSQAYSDLQSEVSSVNEELKGIQTRIEELNSKDKLSFIEQAELERLEKAPIKELVVLNTIDLPPEKRLDKITVISVADIFAAAIENVYLDKPMSKIYD